MENTKYTYYGKLLLVSTLIFMIFFWQEAKAQSSNSPQKDYSSELSMIKSVLQMEKKEFIRINMQLNSDQSAIFWPIYESYLRESGKGLDKIISILNEMYRNNNNKLLDNDYKNKMMLQILSINEKRYRVLRRYYKKIRNKVSQNKADLFLLLEEYVRCKLKVALISEFPFLDTNNDNYTPENP